MSVLLQINQICKSYGPKVILDDATVSLNEGQKIGMIGRNGAGKSTLCRIIMGEEHADSGEIIPNSNLRMSHLEQHDVFKEGETVLDYLMRSTSAEAWECGQTAYQFNIQNDMLEKVVQSLPGGYQTRVKLTSMLLRDPNFLLLDEPSNYLDLSTLILLENFLKDFKGGHLVVSHDREFLKRTCEHTLELESGQLTMFPGSIEEYFEFKEEQMSQKEATNKTIQKKRDQLQEFVNRFRAKASTASRAQSKMKQLEKLKTIEIGHQLSTVRIHIPQPEPRSGVAFSCDELSIGYEKNEVATGIHVEVDRGDRVAILGDNGQGKTTFMRTIAGDLPKKGGSFKWANNLNIAYYAQHVFSALEPEDTVYSHLASVGSKEVTNQDILQMAGCFLFKGDDTKKKVKVLSGGERARLILAGLLLTKSQILMLDEPTNHLDFETVEALGHALKKFTGTVFFISHDRTFVNLIATMILEFKNGRLRRYPGTYEDYVYHLERVARGEEQESEDPYAEDVIPKKKNRKKEEPASKTMLKEEKKPKELKSLEEKAAKTDKRLHHTIRERDKIHEEIASNPFHYSKERDQRLKKLQIDIEKLEEEWCTLQEKLDQLKSKNV